MPTMPADWSYDPNEISANVAKLYVNPIRETNVYSVAVHGFVNTHEMAFF